MKKTTTKVPDLFFWLGAEGDLTPMDADEFSNRIDAYADNERRWREVEHEEFAVDYQESFDLDDGRDD
jgi:hypothetical protein